MMRRNRYLSCVWAAVWCLGSLGRGRRWLSIAMIAFAVLWAQAELSPVGQPIARGTEASIRKTHNTVQWAAFAFAVRYAPESVCLVPGGGFAGATATPSAVGDSGADFYSEKSIARWDVVPYQTFTGLFKIGVVAFHTEGIDRVSFSVDGGPWKDATSMTLNSRTGVTEYCAVLKASLHADGPIQVRAIAYPVNGVPRLLAGDTDSGNGEVSLFLNANAGGTLPANVAYVDSTNGSDSTGDGTSGNPFQSIMKAAFAVQTANGTGNADGGTVYLLAGDHVLGTYDFNLQTTTVNGWLTIAAAPGLAQSDVTITGSATSDGIRTTLVHIQGITIAGILDTVNGCFLWTDGCDIVGPGRTVDSSPGYAPNFSAWATNSEIHGWALGITGSVIRDCTAHDLAGVAYQNGGLVVNSVAYDLDATGTINHPDVYQFFGNKGNVILYGLTTDGGVKAQGVFCGTDIDLTDAAIVNCHIDNAVSGVGRCFSFSGPTKNLYVKDSTFIGGQMQFDGDFAATDVVIENSSFTPDLPAADGVTVR